MGACRIVSILPRRDSFSSQTYGAVSLSVAELARYSQFRHAGMVLGAACDDVLDTDIFQPVTYTRNWLQRRSHAYIQCAVSMLGRNHQYLVELHNRPQLLPYLANRSNLLPVLFFHNDPLSIVASQTPAQRMNILHQCAHVLFNSEYTRNRFIMGLHLDAQAQSKLSVQYFGVDFGREPLVDLSAKKRQLVFVGKLDPNKGPLLALQAAKQVLPKFPDWKIRFIGPDTRHEKAYAASFHRERLALGAQCHYQSFVPQSEIMAAFRESAIACLPSVWEEPLGRVVLEAMAMGCACITSKRGGIPELVGDAGVCLTDLSVDAIAQQMQWMIEDDELRRDFQQRALQRMQTHFDLKQQTAILDNKRLAIMAAMHRESVQ